MSVGEAVRKLREKLGLTQAEFARRIGVTTRALQRYEADARMPEPAALIGIIRAATEAGLPCGVFALLLEQALGMDKLDFFHAIFHRGSAPRALLIAARRGEPARYIETFAHALAALEGDDSAERERARRALDSLAKAMETEGRPDNG